MAKSKQLTRPRPKKQKAKSAEPQTADDFQEAADFEEETGGKWRAGDPAKSGRAFVRALEIYDRGLQKHPTNFDLAYNKARLELEITQRPALVSHIGLPRVDLLKQTLDSHRYALRLNEQNPDVLFNTSQVLTSLAEQLSEADDTTTAIPLLQEALEVLSACCSRKEMLLEQQQADFEEAGEGGVAQDPDERPVSTPGSEQSEQTATIESPVTPNDLLDTVHASLSALTTLVALVELHALDCLGEMAQSLTENMAPVYVGMLPEDSRESARFAVALDRANFVAAFAYAQFNAYLIETETYASRLEDVFNIPGKYNDATALSSGAEARTEFAVSVLARYSDSPELPADMCWKQLKLAQDLYTKVVKLESSAQVYLSRGNVEVLRHRIAITPHVKLAESVRKSAPTLAQNALTYYKGAARLATEEEGGVKGKALRRIGVIAYVRSLLHGVELSADVQSGVSQEALEECVEEGLIDAALADEVARRAAVVT